ncbi:hypothetical protein EDD11_008021 [Mortierella claussenii]|nr:hypothetical protein EDD11_008021 [Mortierella claussenii]
MGSSLSKPKNNNRHSTSSEAPSIKKTKAKNPFFRARANSDVSVAQNPQRWSSQAHFQQQRRAAEDSVHCSPMNNYDSQGLVQHQGQDRVKSNDTKGAWNSGNNVSPHSNVNQPRTSMSQGRPSFSLLRGRKSGQHQREHEQHKIIHISSPIIEPIITTTSSNYSKDYGYRSLSTEQPPPSSLHGINLDQQQRQQQQQRYMEPFRPVSEVFTGLTPEQQAQQLQDQQAQQHALLKYRFKGNYHAPLNKQNLGSVLDVGCGVGSWMKDMALEFPLTEIHGVDLTIPTRRRRPRVAGSFRRPAPSSPTLSHLSSIRRAEQYSSLQRHSSSSASTQSLTSPITPTILDSMPNNCFFHKADIQMGLPFKDNTFDYCHVRLVLWGYRLNCFPELLNELIRVTKKGGWIEFVDMDPCIMKATETGECINEWIKTGLIHSNMDPDLVKTLPQFLEDFCEATTDAALPETSNHATASPNQRRSRSSFMLPTQTYGLENLKVSKVSLPYGPWGGKVGELWQEAFTMFLKGLEPMMQDATSSGLVMDQYHRRLTSYDQKTSTRKVWYQLIHQLAQDASLSAVPDSTSSSTMNSSPSSSVKEMRSYHNFYIAYAQKVDLIELKQQQLLQQLEQEILSPNPNMASSSMFALADAARTGIARPSQSSQAQAQKQVGPWKAETYAVAGGLDASSEQTRRLASTLREKLSSPNLHQRYISSSSATLSASDNDRNMAHNAEGIDNGFFASRNKDRYGLVASLTQDALETFNRTNSRDDGTASPSSSAMVPTPTSVAALSIRSSSRNSNRNGSFSGSTSGVTGFGPQQAVSTPGSVTSASGYLNSRNATAVEGLRRQSSVPSGLGSPQSQHSELRKDGFKSKGTLIDMDYFSQSPIPHHSPLYQQQMNTLHRKPSLLSRVHVPKDTTAFAATGIVNSTLVPVSPSDDESSDESSDREHICRASPALVDEISTFGQCITVNEDDSSEQQLNLVERAKEQEQERRQKQEGKEEEEDYDDDDEGSNILIALKDDDSEQDDYKDDFEMMTQVHFPEGIVGVVPEHSTAVRKHLVPIKSSSAIVEHLAEGKYEVEGDENSESQDDTIQIINRVSHNETKSPKEEMDKDENESDETFGDGSQIQMLPVPGDEEVPVMTISEAQEAPAAPPIEEEKAQAENHEPAGASASSAAVIAVAKHDEETERKKELISGPTQATPMVDSNNKVSLPKNNVPTVAEIVSAVKETVVPAVVHEHEDDTSIPTVAHIVLEAKEALPEINAASIPGSVAETIASAESLVSSKPS